MTKQLASEQVRSDAILIALKTAEAMVYCCGHPRGGCPNHCDLLVNVIDACRKARRALLASESAPASEPPSGYHCLACGVDLSLHPVSASAHVCNVAPPKSVPAAKPQVADEWKPPKSLNDLAGEWDKLEQYYQDLANTQPANYACGSYTGKAIGISICAAQLRAAGTSQPQPSVEESGWLVERHPGPEWLCAWSGGFEWTKDSLKAIRFCRKQDANQIAEIFDGEDVHITEHSWS